MKIYYPDPLKGTSTQTWIGIGSTDGGIAPVVHSAPPSTGRVPYGQGRKVMTLLGEQAYHVPIVTDSTYELRNTQIPGRIMGSRKMRKGDRPMHKTTFSIFTQPCTDYTSTSKTYFSGSRHLQAEDIPKPYPSQQVSQIQFDGPEEDHFGTSYTGQFPYKGADPPSKIHRPTKDNKLNMHEGKDVKQVMAISKPTSEKYWTQYNRIHNKLGVLLGPGVGREYPVRKKYNMFTGDQVGSAWQPENRRISGNRMLYHSHRTPKETSFILG